MPSLQYRLIALVSIFVIVCDQIVKWRMVAWLGPSAAERRWDLMGSFLAFEYVENTGAAFGILAGRVWLVSILALVVAALFVVLVVFGLEATPLNHVASGMIIGGAAGNMIDRLRLGYVIDYIAVGGWPRFNLADSAVTVGIALVIMKLVRDGDHDAESDGTTVESSGAPRSIPYKDQHERNDSVR